MKGLRGRRRVGALHALAAGLAGTALLLAAGGAQALGYKIFTSFGGNGNGIPGFPASGVVVDKNDTNYGLTGSVGYSLTKAGVATTLKAFGGNQGSNPDSDLTVDLSCAIKGANCTFYGTTYYGGTYDHGVVYAIARKGGYRVFHSFAGGNDGANPRGTLVVNAGTIYGMTQNGGPKGYGTVFKIAPDGTKTTLKNFLGPNGSDPGAGGLSADAAGNLYGTTFNGGPPFKSGIAFKLTPDGTQTTLHAFDGATEGSSPDSGLVLDKDGNVYGTTYSGGPGNNGTVFKISPNKKITILYAFTNSTDGRNPTDNHLTLDSAGNVFGTTQIGGDPTCNCGVVYEVSASGQFSVLHRFKGNPTDGAQPIGTIFLDGYGILHGVTNSGGVGNANSGVIYEIRGAAVVTLRRPGHRPAIEFAGMMRRPA